MHSWTTMPRWKKRISGALCYAVAAVCALIWPEKTDRAMYKTLGDQFKGEGRES